MSAMITAADTVGRPRESVSPPATTRADRVSPATAVFEALSRGGIRRGVTEGELAAFARGVADVLPPVGSAAAGVRRRLAEWSRAGGVPVGGGFAVPTPDAPTVVPHSRPTARLFLLAEPREQTGPDGQPVDAVFFVFGPTTHACEDLCELISGLATERSFGDAVRAGRTPDLRVR